MCFRAGQLLGSKCVRFRRAHVFIVFLINLDPIFAPNYSIMLQGLFFIFLFLALGNLASSLMGGWLPGNVIGMVMLFLSLLLGWIKPEKVKKAANGIMEHMALYFVPVGVGLMTSVSLIGRNLWAIVVASVVSTLLVIAATAFVQQKMEQWKK